MSPTDKHNLTNEIFLCLESTHSEEELKQIFKKYNIDLDLSKSYTIDQLKQIVRDSKDETALNIAIDLGLSVTIYTQKNSTKKQHKVTYLKKVFVSHAPEDAEIASDFIQILEGIGVAHEHIFCSSLEGYGTPLGNNFEEEIKKRLSDDVLVLFLISNNFYNSTDCLLQMGAAWGLTKEQISIAIPPFDLKEIKGVFQKFQSIHIDQEKQLNLLKETLESKLNIEPKGYLKWEYKRDLTLKSIREHLTKNNEH
ncbi:toll/interleukin-1 receptor domain-containing protein [Tenacibaculum agarivorans]|uniref:toll/interleukin-1 receptor domain-containing protein n=1 Tax=Tenacibaculum agarivorans TaxID=1908389 RepID=UPI00094B8DD0|nr:toll/interleukin-1 receptor domain-containing protein [Tenacibaculum agarivorans]